MNIFDLILLSHLKNEEFLCSSDRKFPKFFITFLSRTLLVSSMIYQMQERFLGTPFKRKELMALSYKSNFRIAKGSVFVCESVFKVCKKLCTDCTKFSHSLQFINGLSDTKSNLSKQRTRIFEVLVTLNSLMIHQKEDIKY